MAPIKHLPGQPVSALVLLADGSEELEAITIVNILRRAHINVTLASVDVAQMNGTSLHIAHCSRDVLVAADTSLSALIASNQHHNYHIVVLPGGMKGAQTFQRNEAVQSLIKAYFAHASVAAICAAPLALLSAGVGEGFHITAYPCFEPQLSSQSAAASSSLTVDCIAIGHFKYVHEKVVIHDNVITSQGPATAMVFALSLVEYLCGAHVRQQVEKDLLF